MSAHMIQRVGAAAMQGARRSRLDESEYLLDYTTDVVLTRASEAAAVDPRDGWAFYDLATPWPGANVPRILPDGAILIEGARTNVLTFSEDFANASWSKETTVRSNELTAPDGGADADVLVADGSPADRIYKADSTALPRVLSCYYRASGSQQSPLRGRIGTDPTTSPNFHVTDATVAWRRTSAVNSTDAGGFAVLAPVRPPNSDANGGTAGDEVGIWGAQVEAGAFPSSPIRTVGAAATRQHDQVDVANGFPVSMLSGRWTFDWWPNFASTEAPTTCALFNFNTTSGHRIDVNGGRVRLVDSGGVRVQSNALTWSRYQKLTITVDVPAGEVSVSGATNGNGAATGTPPTWTNGGSPRVGWHTGNVIASGVFSRPRAA